MEQNNTSKENIVLKLFDLLHAHLVLYLIYFITDINVFVFTGWKLYKSIENREILCWTWNIIIYTTVLNISTTLAVS